MEIFKLFGSVLVDTAEAEKSISKTDEKAEGLGKKLQNGSATAKKWAIGLGAAAASVGAAMLKTAKDTAAHADEIDKMSQKLGLSREAYQEWDYVLSQAGVDIGSMETGMKTLTNQLDDAKNGSEKAQKRFEALGLSLEDLQSMSREDIFEATITGFQNMEDSTERAALANDLFGKSGQNLTALFNESAESTQALIEKTHELGLVMSDEAVSAGVDMTDAMDTAKRSFESIFAEIGSQLMPVFNELLGWIIEHMPQIKKMVGDVVAFIQSGIKELEPIIKAMGPVVEKVFGVIGYAWENYLKPIFMGIIEFLDGVFSGNWEKIFSGLGTIVENIFKAIIGFVKIPINAIIELLNKAIDGFNKIQIPDWVPLVGGKGLDIPHIPALAKGGDIQDAGTVLVGEKGPEFLNLPQGARVTPLKNLTPVSQDNSEVVSLLKQILDKLDESKAININKREFARIVSEVS